VFQNPRGTGGPDALGGDDILDGQGDTGQGKDLSGGDPPIGCLRLLQSCFRGYGDKRTDLRFHPGYPVQDRPGQFDGAYFPFI